MAANTVGFIGGGRIARIILSGWQRAEYMPAEVVVSEPNSEVLKKLKEQFPTVRSTPDAPWRWDTWTMSSWLSTRQYCWKPSSRWPGICGPMPWLCPLPPRSPSRS